MKPFFLFTMPRSGGTALQRMLDACEGVRCEEESKEWLADLKRVGEGLPGVKSLLKDRVRMPLRADFHGIRSSFCGRGEWEEAVALYSWLLRDFPTAVIIFLIQRDDEQLERSLFFTWPLWIPGYGTCHGNVLNRARDQRQWMLDFAEMNPRRCVVIDHADLGDFDLLRELLVRAGLVLQRDAWEKQRQERPGAYVSIRDEIDRMAEARRAVEAVEAESWEELPEDPDADAQMLAELERMEQVAEERDHRVMQQAAAAGPLRPPLPKKDPAERLCEVHTIRFGNPPWMRACAASLEDWVVRHGMSLRVWGEAPHYPNAKFQMVDMLRGFLEGPAEVMLYVDADVFVHPLAPPLEAFPGLAIRVDVMFKAIRERGWEKWCEEHFPGVDVEGWKYRNAGVWSCDRAAAAKLLAVIEEPYVEAVMEQHQFNFWIHQARRAGMILTDLPLIWNRYASERLAGWFHHLSGRKCKVRQLEHLRALNLLPQPPEKFEHREPSGERAICYLWCKGKAVWEELKYSLRSVREHFEDCPPIHIFGDARPEWLVDGQGVEFHLVPGYAGAVAAAVQEAREVVLWNDDIYCLRRTSWGDLGTALTRRRNLLTRVQENLLSRNKWRQSVGRATASLYHHGVERIRDFSTHTPYLFERDKAIETLQRHGVWWKIPMEVLYHNDHGTKNASCGEEKTQHLPCRHDARWLNHGGAGPDPRTKAELVRMFREPAPWEVEAGAPRRVVSTVAVVQAIGGHAPHVEEFKRWNPEVPVCVIEMPKLEDEARRRAWYYGDEPIMAWWSRARLSFAGAERFVFLEWDVKFSARVEDVFPDEGDFFGPDVHALGDGRAWGWWKDVELLPEGLREHARGVAPLAVMALSRQALESMFWHPLRAEAMACRAFCELRFATLATAAGYPPVKLRALREVGLVDVDPMGRPGVWHPVKI